MREILVHDIYSLEPMSYSSLYLFIFLVIVLSGTLFFLTRRLIKKYHENKNRAYKQAIRVLKKCDFSEVKNTAYRISYYGEMLAQTTEERKLFQTLLKALEPFKYKKEVTEFPESIKDLLGAFILKVESRYVG